MNQEDRELFDFFGMTPAKTPKEHVANLIRVRQLKHHESQEALHASFAKTVIDSLSKSVIAELIAQAVREMAGAEDSAEPTDHMLDRLLTDVESWAGEPVQPQ